MQEQEIVAEFDYRPGRIKAVLLTCLVLAGVGLFVCFAFNLAQPIAVLGIQFTARQGRIFFGVFACLSVIGVVPMAGMVHLAFIGKRRVALTATAILAPRPTRFGLSREEIAIPVRVDSFGGTATLCP